MHLFVTDSNLLYCMKQWSRNFKFGIFRNFYVEFCNGKLFVVRISIVKRL